MQLINFRQTRCFLRLLYFLCVCVGVLFLTGCTQRVVWEDISTAQTEKTVTAKESGNSSAESAQNTSEKPDDKTSEDETETEFKITVHVCGAVRNPGVYRIPSESRLIDAVQAAGGFAENADVMWCNQARYVADQEQVRIYTVDETVQLSAAGGKPESAFSSEQSGSLTGGKINLNTASSEELQTLPGIGASRAEAIIAYREEHGGFSAIEDIMKISGIKDAMFSKIKDKITV